MSRRRDRLWYFLCGVAVGCGLAGFWSVGLAACIAMLAVGWNASAPRKRSGASEARSDRSSFEGE